MSGDGEPVEVIVCLNSVAQRRGRRCGDSTEDDIGEKFGCGYYGCYTHLTKDWGKPSNVSHACPYGHGGTRVSYTIGSQG